MRITVRLFASHRETLGRTALEAELPEGTTAAGALAHVRAAHPQLAAPDDAVAFALNREHVEPHAVLHDGDELALLPPVAGG